MGWFSSTPATPIPITREDREACWESRDIYFACLDKNRVVKPGTEGKECKSEEKAYTGKCGKTWVRNQ